MAKSKNKKKIPKLYKKVYPFLLLIATLFMGIGYAKVSDINLTINGDAFALAQNGIFITTVRVLNNGQTGNGSVVGFNDTLLNTNITLENNKDSSVTFEVSIGNNSTDGLTHYFTGVTPNSYDADFYPNRYITYELNGLEKGDALDYKDEITFTITFKYKTDVNFNAPSFSNSLLSYLNFNFHGVSMDQPGRYEYVVPVTGNYKLDVWGASGYSYSDEYHGGYGAYSTGEVYLEKGTKLYIHTGGTGTGGNQAGTYQGGYNGGGKAVLDNDSKYTGSGGGATHIAFVDGEISQLQNNIGDILIVAGGGGAVYYENNYVFLGGHGGGIEGTGGIQIRDENILNGPANALSGGGNQNAGGTAGREGAVGTFGHGAEKDELSIGAGGGFYGGGNGWASSAGGGSGYIGNNNLVNKHMIVYSETPETIAPYVPAVASNDVNTATNIVYSYSTSATPDVAKSGDGFAKIVYIDGNDTYVVTNEYITIFGTQYEVIDAHPTLTTSSNNSTDASGLYKTTDTDNGNPTYYFRGNVNNNYVDFAGYVWRIIRVNEDGSIRVIMNTGIDNNANNVYYNSNDSYEYTYYTNTNNNNGAKQRLDNWYNNNIGNNVNYANKVMTGNYFCEAAKVKNLNFTNPGNANTIYYNQYTPNFSCPTDGNGKGIVNSAIGLISYDEVVFAGGYLNIANDDYYLNNGSLAWTISPGGISDTDLPQTWRIEANGALNSGRVTYNRTFRPVINLKSDITVTGDGTENNHFVVQ